MRIGAALVAALIGLGAVATLVSLTPDKGNAEEIETISSSLQVHINKKMYNEAEEEYRSLLSYEEFDKDYEKWNEYKEFCYDHNFTSSFISASRYLLSLDPANTKPASDVLEWYKENSFNDVYSWLSYLKGILSEEDYKEFAEYYDTVKGLYSAFSSRYSELGDWSLASFGSDAYLIGTSSEGKPVVIGADGETIISGEFESICSYSFNEKLISTLNDDQLVYVNLADNRKRVPYDYESGVLINNKYLGPFYSGIANYCGSDDKWGYINSNADKIYAGYSYTSPGSEGIFSARSEDGKWSIFYKKDGGLGLLAATDYDDIKLDEYGYMIKNSVFFGKENGLWYQNKIVANDEGEYSIKKYDTAYEDVKPFGELGAVMLSGKWGFVNDSGEMIIDPRFDDAKSFSCGFAAVKNGDRWGYIDMAGKTAIDFAFQDANSFSNYGISAVRENDRWMLIQLNEYKISGGTYK